MIFTSNMPNKTKDRVLKAAKLSNTKITITKPSYRLPKSELNDYFGLYRHDFDISDFWREYDKLTNK